MTDILTIQETKRTRRYIENALGVLGKRKFYRTTLPFFKRQALLGASHIVKNFLSGQRLKRRSGQLARSTEGRVQRFGGLPAIRIGVFRGPALAYARVQEYGTVGKGGTLPTITPKRAKALAIPVGPALTPTGQSRFRGPTHTPVDLKFVPFRSSGVAVGGLFEEQSLEEAITLKDARMWYLLVSEVDIPPSRAFRDGMRSYAPILARELGVFLRDVLRAEKLK